MLAPKNLMKQLYNFFRRKASVCEARLSACPCKECVLPLDKRIALCYNTTNITGKLRRMLLSNTTKLNKAKRTLLLVVVAAFATLVVFSLFFTGYEQGHECINSDCCICALMSECMRITRHTKSCASAPGALFAPVFFVAAAAWFLQMPPVAVTPVKLKVKITN